VEGVSCERAREDGERSKRNSLRVGRSGGGGAGREERAKAVG
jgi:hypothetical protein